MAAANVRFVLDESAVDALMRDREVRQALLSGGNILAIEAKRYAPRATGRGADSIHAQFAPGGKPEVQVSWDRRHFYMYFHEYGAAHTPEHAFMRPALQHAHFTE